MFMHNFQELIIWQKAMEIAEKVYLTTSNFPKEEKFGLKSQIRRTAISIASNIAEGAGRNTNGEFRSFLGIANGSANELFTQLVLSTRLNLISAEIIDPLLNEITAVEKINYSLIRKFSKTK
jgi:four helix bundle protein